MRRRTCVASRCAALTLSAFVLFLEGGLPLYLWSSPGPDTPAEQTALLTKYCSGCHNERLRSGGIFFDKTTAGDVEKNAELLEKVVHKLRSGEMPPPGMPRPDKAVLDGFARALEVSLDRVAAARPSPGRVAVHRLNRTEYGNAIRDLLALDIDVKTLLSPDGVDERGFDNIAGILTVSPALMEQYMTAARRVSLMAVGNASAVPVFDTYTVPGTLSQDDRMDEDLPFGSRGGLAVRHYFPKDGEYEIRIRLKRQLYGYILGMGRQHRMEVSLDGKTVKSFTVGGDAPAGPSPATYAGNIMGNPQWDLYMHEADAGLVMRVQAKAGTSTVAIWFAKDLAVSEDIPQPPETGFGLSINEMYQGNPAVENVAIGGPYRIEGLGDTPSRRSIFECRPPRAGDEEACARRIVSKLARRAYRRPVTEAEIGILLGFYRQGRDNGGFEAGIELALERTLADPNFLFRVEREPQGATTGTVYRLSDLELASRLSFFLWSSIPDDELLDKAVNGKLHDPDVLQKEVRRMLADQRSIALVHNFGMAWLDLAKVRTALPDLESYPDFDDNLRAAFLEETQLFLESQMRDDRSISEMLTADYTFLNERLARHYHIPGIYGSHFRRVKLNDPNRGGLMGQGSILTATSYPNRTSPVLRGKWLLDTILGAPPPPPPPDVPALKDSNAEGKPSSVRERLEEHRKNAACAVCHVRMDPLGFALENFDGIGAWRGVSDGSPVNASASLPDGTRFEGVAGLRQVLSGRREQFAESFISKLMTYALGRELDYHDAPAIRKIARESGREDLRWSSIIGGIVESTPFRFSIVKSNELTDTAKTGEKK
jgi:hypothetical protein